MNSLDRPERLGRNRRNPPLVTEVRNARWWRRRSRCSPP